MDICSLDILKFQERCDPVRKNCWGLDSPITQLDIEKAVSSGNLFSPKSNEKTTSEIHRTKSEHISRIAWFVVHGWNDPIDIDVGVPSLGCYSKWPLEDGNHRFAAAIIRGDHIILAIISGVVSEIENFLWKN